MKLKGTREWTASRDSEGHRTYNLISLILLEDGEGPKDIFDSDLLPHVGDTWSFHGDDDEWAWCRSDMRITFPAEHTPGDPPEWVMVEQPFSTKPPEKDKRRCQDFPVEDPLAEPPKISGSFTDYEEESYIDRFGRIVKTSSHEIIRGKQVEWPDGRLAVRIEMNVLDLQYDLLCAINNTLNKSFMWGLSPRCIKLRVSGFERKFQGVCSVYYTWHFEFEGRKEGFDRDLLDEGTKVLNGHWSTGQSGTGTSGLNSWVLDDVDGGPPDPKNPQHFVRFKDRRGENARVLLNGAGIPAYSTKEVAIFAAEWAPDIMTVTTNVPHNCLVGNKVRIVGASPPGYNGEYVVYRVNSSFSLDINTAADPGATHADDRVGAIVNLDDPAKPGIVHFEKFNETEFTLLGIPLSF